MYHPQGKYAPSAVAGWDGITGMDGTGGIKTAMRIGFFKCTYDECQCHNCILLFYNVK